MAKCEFCQKSLPIFGDPYKIEEKLACFDCFTLEIGKAKAKEAEANMTDAQKAAQRRDQEIEKIMPLVLIVTTPSVPGKNIAKVFDCISEAVVMGTGLFTELESDISDFLGLEAGSYQSKSARAERLVAYRLKKRAFEMGANAIVGANYDHCISAERGQLLLAVSGTPVLLEE